MIAQQGGTSSSGGKNNKPNSLDFSKRLSSSHYEYNETTFNDQNIPDEAKKLTNPLDIFAVKTKTGTFFPVGTKKRIGIEIAGPSNKIKSQESEEEERLLDKIKDLKKETEIIFNFIESSNISSRFEDFDEIKKEIEEKLTELLNKIQSKTKSLKDIETAILSLQKEIEEIKKSTTDEIIYAEENLGKIEIETVKQIERYAVLKYEAEKLSTNKKLDQNIILKLYETLEKLTDFEQGGIIIRSDENEEEVKKLLFNLTSYVDEANDYLTQEEERGAEEKENKLKKLEEEKKLLLELSTIHKILAALISRASIFISATQDKDKRSSVSKAINEIHEQEEITKNEITRENVNSLSDKLKTFEEFIEEIENEKRNKNESTQTKEQKEDLNKKESKNLPPFDVWSGWPETVIRFKQNKDQKTGKVSFVWEYVDNGNTEKLQNGSLWSMIKTNFDEEFKRYLGFLRGENQNKKIEISKDLIDLKNALVKSIISKNTEDTALHIQLFREKINETISLYEKQKEDERKASEEKLKKENLLKQIDSINENFKKIEKEETTLSSFLEKTPTSFELSSLKEEIKAEILKISSDSDENIKGDEIKEVKNLIEKYAQIIEKTKQEKGLSEKRKVEIFEKVKKSFEDLKKEASSCFLVYEKIFPIIQSPLEKSAIERDYLKIKEQEERLNQKINEGDIKEEDVNIYKEMFITFLGNVNTLKIKIEKGLASVSPISEDKKHPTTSVLTKKSAREIFFDANKEKDFGVLVEKHRQMMAKNYDEYKKVYLNKEWLKGDKNRDAVIFVFKEKVQSLLGKIAQISIDAEQEKDEVERTSEEIGGSHHLNLKKLEAERIVYEKEIREILSGLENETPKDKKETTTSLAKEIYSPKEDKGGFAVGRNINDLSWTDKIKYRNSIKLRQERVGKEVEKMSALSEEELKNYKAEKVPLMSKENEGLRSGMVNSLNTENNIEKVEEKKETEENKLDKTEVLNRINKMFDIRLSELVKKYGKSWKILAYVTAFMLGTAVASAKENNFNVNERPKTIGEAVSWRDNISTKTLTGFLQEISKDGAGLSFILQKYAPSVKFDKNNPASLAKIINIDTNKLLNDEENIYALSDESRKELSNIVVYLQSIAQATQTNINLTEKKEYQKYYINQEGISLQEYFDAVRKMVVEADLLENKK